MIYCREENLAENIIGEWEKEWMYEYGSDKTDGDDFVSFRAE